MLYSNKRARLILSGGEVMQGFSFGSEGSVVGEVVFNTSVVGYQETLTDPGCYGQLVVQTFPLIGNYGVNRESSESDRCHCKGYIVREWCEAPSNFRAEGDINEMLCRQGVVGIYGIDTRALTRKLRSRGVINGMITTKSISVEEAIGQIESFSLKGAVEAVTSQGARRYTCDNPRFEVAVYDLGCKSSTLRLLQASGMNLTLLPACTPARQILEMGADGVAVLGGPGNPADNPGVVDCLRELMQAGVPMLGVSLGHQLIALAAGGSTYRLGCGHRGGNQPVRELKSGRVLVTGQNHGYAVDMQSIPADIGELSHVNINDSSCEGIRYTSVPCITVQFDPESCTGARGDNSLIDEFADMMCKRKGGE